jgi:hypothetical protein
VTALLVPNCRSSFSARKVAPPPPAREAVDHDLAAIDAFQPPDGRIVLAVDGDGAYGIGCLRRIRGDRP